eukprot:gb/GEZN01000303.1/.p2 GENE.gb/GEZN01000303.1/~~gb/GEZN01000303.1/.p2  ORF type:complete len:768 (+),score=72.96 gb/GEZN01000303.1/:92-2305(+)
MSSPSTRVSSPSVSPSPSSDALSPMGEDIRPVRPTMTRNENSFILPSKPPQDGKVLPKQLWEHKWPSSKEDSKRRKKSRGSKKKDRLSWGVGHEKKVVSALKRTVQTGQIETAGIIREPIVVPVAKNSQSPKQYEMQSQARNVEMSSGKGKHPRSGVKRKSLRKAATAGVVAASRIGVQQGDEKREYDFSPPNDSVITMLGSHLVLRRDVHLIAAERLSKALAMPGIASVHSSSTKRDRWWDIHAYHGSSSKQSPRDSSSRKCPRDDSELPTDSKVVPAWKATKRRRSRSFSLPLEHQYMDIRARTEMEIFYLRYLHSARSKMSGVLSHASPPSPLKSQENKTPSPSQPIRPTGIKQVHWARGYNGDSGSAPEPVYLEDVDGDPDTDDVSSPTSFSSSRGSPRRQLGYRRERQCSTLSMVSVDSFGSLKSEIGMFELTSPTSSPEKCTSPRKLLSPGLPTPSPSSYSPNVQLLRDTTFISQRPVPELPRIHSDPTLVSPVKPQLPIHRNSRSDNLATQAGEGKMDKTASRLCAKDVKSPQLAETSLKSSSSNSRSTSNESTGLQSPLFRTHPIETNGPVPEGLLSHLLSKSPHPHIPSVSATQNNRADGTSDSSGKHDERGQQKHLRNRQTNVQMDQQRPVDGEQGEKGNQLSLEEAAAAKVAEHAVGVPPDLEHESGEETLEPEQRDDADSSLRPLFGGSGVYASAPASAPVSPGKKTGKPQEPYQIPDVSIQAQQ